VSVEIRTVEREELPAWQAAMRVGFHQPRADASRDRLWLDEWADEVDWARIHGAFDDGRVVATYRSFGTPLTVPGGEVAAGAITNITVSPTHRRRRLLSTLMASDLAASAERGEAVAILIASEYPIYGRYGFGPAADTASYKVDARGARFARDGAGEPRLVSAEELVEAAAAVYDAHRRATPGAIERGRRWWERRVGLALAPRDVPGTQHCVVARDGDGAPAGVLVYHVEEGWEDWRPRATLHVEELFARTPDVEARLWRFACEVDLVATVHAEQRGVDERLPWMLEDARAVRADLLSDFLWVRVLDAPAALGARTYPRAGEVVLGVRDALGYAAGRFALRAGPDGAAECAATDADPDIELDVGALSAAYLGGRSLVTLAAAGWATERRAGALALADAMFRTPVAPWNATMF
jgi:predicted acetyltransferase